MTVSLYAMFNWDTNMQNVTKYFPSGKPNIIRDDIAAMQHKQLRTMWPFLLELKTLILSLMNPYTIFNDHGIAIKPIKNCTSVGSSFKWSLNNVSSIRSKNCLNPCTKLQIIITARKDLSN